MSKQTEKRAEKIRQAIDRLPQGDVKKLRGFSNAYRLRVGDVRVLFDKDGDRITVVDIDNRGDVYKRGG